LVESARPKAAADFRDIAARRVRRDGPRPDGFLLIKNFADAKSEL